MPDMDVPQVNREVVQEPLHICPLLIPPDQAMDGGTMPEIVQPWLVASAVRPSYPREIPEPFERAIHGLHLNHASAFAEEETTPRIISWVRCRSPTRVFGQHASQLWPDRDQSRLEELGITNGNQGVRQI